MTYNIHGCVVAGRKVDPEKIAAILESTGADCFALQEVNAFRAVREQENQARTLSGLLGCNHIYYPIAKIGPRDSGLAVLSRHPLAKIAFLALPSLFPGPLARIRGAMRVALQTASGPIELINTHLSLYPLERELQVQALVKWCHLIKPLQRPLLLCGDLNAGPSTLTYHKLSRVLTDAQCSAAGSPGPRPTFPAGFPFLRIDHVFASDRLDAVRSSVIRNSATEKASDHLPLQVDLICRP